MLLASAVTIGDPVVNLSVSGLLVALTLVAGGVCGPDRAPVARRS